MPARHLQHLFAGGGGGGDNDKLPSSPPSNTPIPRSPFSSNINLSGAGLIALTGLKSIQIRTALVGGARYLDYFWLVPGLHLQQDAAGISAGEFPPSAAMTTGYVFRVENAATAWFLQRVGETGALVECEVRPLAEDRWDARRPVVRATTWLLEIMGPLLTVASLVIVGVIGDWWTMFVLGVLLVTRIVNCFIIASRSTRTWKGAHEPGVRGDLLVLMARDKWIRLTGTADDLEAVTAGAWLRDMTSLEGFLEGITKMAVYVPAGLVQNSTQMGQLTLAALQLASAALMGLVNYQKSSLEMNGRRLRVVGKSHFHRRTDMVKSLVDEVGDNGGWVGKLGLLLDKTGDDGQLQAVVV